MKIDWTYFDLFLLVSVYGAILGILVFLVLVEILNGKE